MKEMINRMIEPKHSIAKERQIFSNADLKTLILPLFLEQLLEVLVGVADTFMVSYAGEAAVSGVSLVNMFNTVFLYHRLQGGILGCTWHWNGSGGDRHRVCDGH